MEALLLVGLLYAMLPLQCWIKSRLGSVTKKGLYLKELPYQELGERPHVNEVHWLGLVVGMEMDVQASPLVDACINAGLPVLTAGKGNVVKLVPPLIISEKELEQAAEVLRECLPVLDANTPN